MATKFITKGRGKTKKVIPLKGRVSSNALVPKQFYADMPIYMHGMARTTPEQRYLDSWHIDLQLLNHLRGIQNHMISKVGAKRYAEIDRLYKDMKRTFDIDGFLHSEGVSGYKRFWMSWDDKFRLMLHLKGIDQHFIDDFFYLRDRDFEFDGLDGKRYHMKKDYLDLSKHLITPEIAPLFERYVSMNEKLSYYNCHPYENEVPEERVDALRRSHAVAYHEAYKNKRGYIKV